jgi:hypothetical protein
LLLVLATPLWAEGEDPPEPAPKVMRFVKRAVAWYPNSTFRLVSNTRFQTPSGAYRFVEVERTCASKVLTGWATMLIDEIANTVWLGGVAELPPFQDAGAGPEALREFLSQFLPKAHKASMGVKVEVEWNAGPRRPGTLIPFFLRFDSGYGTYRRQAAVTTDGKYLVMGSEIPLDEDPVAYRRRILAESDLVVWDNEPGKETPLEIVEFSDLECPACKDYQYGVAEKYGPDTARDGEFSIGLPPVGLSGRQCFLVRRPPGPAGADPFQGDLLQLAARDGGFTGHPDHGRLFGRTRPR